MKDVDLRIASQVAFIDLSNEEKKLCEQMLTEDIGSYEKMLGIDVSSVGPTFLLNKELAFREDIVKPSLNRDELLKNAKDKSDDAFCVPKIVE